MAIALCVAAALAVACDDGPTAPSQLRGVTWKLESIERENAAPIRPSDPDRYTLRFETDARVSVRSDCNSCGGGYDIDGSSLSLPALACTRAFCGESSLDAEFTSALSAVRTLSGSDTQLVLRGTGVVMRFRN